MTLHVVIWDNDSKDVNTLQEKIQYTDCYDVDLLTTTDVRTVNRYIKNMDVPAIFFLAISDPEDGTSPGFQIAQRAKRKSRYNTVIFVTDSLSRLAVSPESKLLGDTFICKKQKNWELDILNILDYTLNQSGKKCLSIGSADTMLRIALNDIYYIETIAQKHKSTIHYKHGACTCGKSLKEIEVQLDDTFTRCRRGTIVNVKKIQIIQPDYHLLLLNNGSIIDYTDACFNKEKRNKWLHQNL